MSGLFFRRTINFLNIGSFCNNNFCNNFDLVWNFICRVLGLSLTECHTAKVHQTYYLPNLITDSTSVPLTAEFFLTDAQILVFFTSSYVGHSIWAVVLVQGVDRHSLWTKNTSFKFFPEVAHCQQIFSTNQIKAEAPVCFNDQCWNFILEQESMDFHSIKNALNFLT